MMKAVMSSPPEWSSLGGRRAYKCKHELKCPAGFKTLVREITVIKGRDRKHPDQVQKYRDGHRKPGGLHGKSIKKY